MPRYRTRLPEVDAIQWQGPGHEIPGVPITSTWDGDRLQYHCSFPPYVGVEIDNPTIRAGNWIITYPDGRRSVCSTEELARDFEAIEEEKEEET